MLEYILLYMLITILTYVTINYLLSNVVNIDLELAEILNDKIIRIIALTFISISWPIMVPKIIINTIKERSF